MYKLIFGCGYLGRRVADMWRRAGHTVFALTRSATNAAELSRAGLQPLSGDVTDAASLKAALNALPMLDTVLYAVGYDRHSGRSRRAVYVGGLENALRNIVGQTRRFLYISSTSVYGQSSGEWVDEDSPCKPSRENGRICLEAEQLVRHSFPAAISETPPPAERVAFSGASSACILRLAGLYGPGRLLRRVAAVRSGEPIAGNPSAWLNLIHVDDAARAVLACEEHGRAGGTYLIVDDVPLTRREYYETLASLLQAPPPVFQAVADDETATSATVLSAEASLNKRCSNRRLHEELRLELLYPSAQEGLPQALSATL